MVGRNLLNIVVCSLLLAPSGGQAYDEYVDYGGQDYPQDNLYHDYAIKQQEKEVGAGLPWGKIMMGTSVGWILGGKFHAQRKEKKLNAKHKQDTKVLYTQYYNDVYTLQQQNAEMAQALEQLGVSVK